MAKRPELVLMEGERAVARFALKQGTLRLGRSSSNDIHVPDEELSRNHCLFEAIGETGIRVTDLASANGTSVNGKAIGTDSVELHEGDVVEVGRTRISVGEPKSAGIVDLGLETTSAVEAKAQGVSDKKRPPLMNLMWGVSILIALGAMALIVFMPSEKTPPVVQTALEERPQIREVSYEKVKADQHGIFRYALTAQANGALVVKIDDTANDRRLPPKSKPLSAEGLEELNEILSWPTMADFEAEYAGVEPDPPALDSVELKVIYTSGVRRVAVINTALPEAFAVVCSKLEAFSRSELGVWAIAYSREKLVAMAEEAVDLARMKWEDRDVNHGNLAAAISACEEALFYLETVNPKPACAQVARERLAQARQELDKRYTDQRFRADRALNLAQWEVACEELKILLEMIPARQDARNRDARQKLVSAESNLKKKAK